MVRAFAGAGMRVVMADVDGVRLDAAAAGVRAAGHEVVGVRTDVSELAQVQALADATIEAFGRVDVVCNNAGVGTFATIEETSITDWEWTLAIDLFGPLYGVKTFLPLLQRNETGGHVNATASMAGLLAGSTLGPYNVAKHGVVALMCTLERELRAAHSNVRASVLCPGPIATGIVQHSSARREADATRVPIDRPDSDIGRRAGAALDTVLAEQGMEPDQVGRMVLDAMISEQFWIFTHPAMLRQVRAQLDAADDDRMLSRLRPV
jgi:NAD(P)-dependent dehydrogenase (short-subunit alcohol dehydrogenase family)